MSRERKAKQREALQDRLDAALQNLYHNATPNHPYLELTEEEQAEYEEWFTSEAEEEINYIRGHGPYGAAGAKQYLKNLELMARPAGMFRQETVKKYGYKEYAYSTACPNDLWCLITDYGYLFQWGRGGRTLAPQDLIKSGSGSTFSIRDDTGLDKYPDLVRLCQVVESFNMYVERWCSRDNILDRWLDWRWNIEVELNDEDDEEEEGEPDAVMVIIESPKARRIRVRED